MGRPARTDGRFPRRLQPRLKPDKSLNLALDQALTETKSELKRLTSANPQFLKGLPTSVAPFSFAVVDLTDDPRISGFGADNPAYAGHNDTQVVRIASLASTSGRGGTW